MSARERKRLADLMGKIYRIFSLVNSGNIQVLPDIVSWFFKGQGKVQFKVCYRDFFEIYSFSSSRHFT